MTVYFRWGADPNGLSDRCKEALRKIQKAFPASLIYVNSTSGGIHGDYSLHYTGNAFDLKHFMDDKKFIEKVSALLGPDWDIVNEVTHMHIEYDPE